MRRGKVISTYLEPATIEQLNTLAEDNNMLRCKLMRLMLVYGITNIQQLMDTYNEYLRTVREPLWPKRLT
jgi:pheromone shutdown protein TraB